MAFNTQKNFTATLDGTNVYSLSKLMDRQKDKFKDRLEHIENILNDTNFFIEYFEGYFPVNINSHDYLSLENNVCLLLEQYASYLLNSSDVKEVDDYQYKFYYDENEFKKALGKEPLYQKNDTDIIDFLLSGQENYKKVKEQKITRQDLNRNDWCGSVLRDYQNYINFLNSIDEKGLKFRVDKIKGSVKQDMLLAKDKILHVFGYNLRYFSESTQADYELVDFTNPIHLTGYSFDNVHHNYARVDGLLQMRFNGDFQNDWQCIIYDAHKLVEKTTLTERQRQCINMYIEGYKNKDIAYYLDIDESTVSRTIDSGIKKICNNAFELGYSSD